MSRIEIDNIEIEAFESAEKEGRICIKWTGNIGWGEYLLWQEEGVWYADSECLDNNNDKEFIRKLLNKFIEQIIIKG